MRCLRGHGSKNEARVATACMRRGAWPAMQGRREELRETYRSFQTKYRELHALFTTLRKGYYLIACAWCQRRIRWVPKEPSVPGEISHGICPLLRGAPPHAAVRYDLGDPQPARGWQEGAAWCQAPVPKTRAQNSQSKYSGGSAPTPSPQSAASASSAGTRHTQS